MYVARELASSITAEIRALIARYARAPGTDEADARLALECGLASLVSLEASLQHVRASGRGEDRDPEEDSLQELERWIELLREALSELRRISMDGRSSPLAFGFVLPAQR
jgi:hypothetical protein